MRGYAPDSAVAGDQKPVELRLVQKAIACRIMISIVQSHAFWCRNVLGKARLEYLNNNSMSMHVQFAFKSSEPCLKDLKSMTPHDFSNLQTIFPLFFLLQYHHVHTQSI